MKLYILIVFSLMTVLDYAPADAIIGEYWTENKTGKIAIFKCDNKYCGRITWRKENRKDVENRDKAKRGRDVVGIQFLNDFEYEVKEEIWSGGTVYSIDNGKTYKGKIWLEEDGKILKMRGFIGFSFIGRTATLERVK
ncbi:MAG: DUF2147 domain-containing protein [Bacteroidota bacterium]